MLGAASSPRGPLHKVANLRAAFCELAAVEEGAQARAPHGEWASRLRMSPPGESVSGLPTRSGGPGQTGKEPKATQVRKPLPQQGLEAFDFAFDLL